MNTAGEPTKVELTLLDIDCRIHKIWNECDELGFDMGTLAPFLRLAYGLGYEHGTVEDGQLYKDNDYAVPVAK